MLDNNNKVNYVEYETAITAKNLNDIQESILKNQEEIKANASQSEHNANELNTYLNSKPRQSKACVSFIDDDGRKEVYERLLPIFKSKNVNFGACLITDWIGVENGYMTLNQVKECCRNGMETLSHTKNVSTNLTDNYSDEQIIEQLKDSKKWLMDNGLKNDGFVYPQSGYNLKIRKYVKEYYKYAFADFGFNSDGCLDQSRIQRIAFGSWTDTNPTINGNSEKNTLNYYKACVDFARDNNTWLVFMLHVNQQVNEQDEILKQLIDYIKESNISIVTPSEGFSIKRNEINVGDLEESYLFFNNGNVETNITAYKFKKPTGFNKDTSITNFEKSCVTVQFFNNADNGGFPDGAGVLETYRATTWEGLSYQIWRPLSANKTYKRNWGSTSWSDFIWLESQASKLITLPPNTVDANTLPSIFENDKITYCLIQSSGATGMPGNKAGVLVTDKIIKVSGYYQQTYYVYGSSDVFIRKVTGETYSNWVNTNPLSLVTLNIPQIVIPANSIAEHEVELVGTNANKTGVTGSPAWGVSSGIMYNVFIKNHNKICISYYNATSNSITLSARNWKFFINND